jgi:DNA repair protein RadC
MIMRLRPRFLRYTADIAVTRDIVKAAHPLGVTVHDHLIIGRGRHTSLRDLGLL